MSLKRPEAVVLDSWAVLAYFQGEPQSEKIAVLVEDALDRQMPVFMTVVNAGEVWYILARTISRAAADSGFTDLQSWGVRIVDIDWQLARQAADFKSRHRISYADAFAAALAKAKKAELVTGDSEFKALDKEIAIAWLK